MDGAGGAFLDRFGGSGNIGAVGFGRDGGTRVDGLCGSGNGGRLDGSMFICCSISLLRY